MSTRCNIILKDKGHQIFLYHHHDGYPEGVGTDMQRFVADINKHYYYSIEDVANRLLKGYDSKFYGKTDMGYELTTNIHGDIEYLYVLYAVRTEQDPYLVRLELECYSVEPVCGLDGHYKGDSYIKVKLPELKEEETEEK